MPSAGANCAILMLGTHAASPELATTSEARQAGVQARVELTTSRDAATPGGAAASMSDHVHAERSRWVKCLCDHGVRLLLSAAPISALTAQLCAKAGICAVPGVDTSDLRALCHVSSCSVLQEWPRTAQLSALLSSRSGFVAHGCTFEVVAMGGRKHTHVKIDGTRGLSTLVVRGASDSLAKEYALAATRALACMRVWLAADEPSRARTEVLHSLPGAGATELQMEACVRALIAGGVWPRGADHTGVAESSSEPKLSVEHIGMLRVLSAALLAVPRQLHRNAQRGMALCAYDGRWPVLLQRLRCAHDQSPTCAVGLVLPRRADGSADASTAARAGLLEVGDAVRAGVLEPLGVKLRVLDDVLTCLAQLLRLDTAVPARKLPQPSRRRRLDGCSSDESDSDESEPESKSSDAEADDEVGVLV